MKKIIIAIALLASLTLSLGTLFGCGSNGSEAGASSSEVSSEILTTYGNIPTHPKDFNKALNDKTAAITNNKELLEAVPIKNGVYNINALDLAARICENLNYVVDSGEIEGFERTYNHVFETEQQLNIGTTKGDVFISYNTDGLVTSIEINSFEGDIHMVGMVNAAVFGLGGYDDFPGIFDENPALTVTTNYIDGSFDYKGTHLEELMKIGSYFRLTYTPVGK